MDAIEKLNILIKIAIDKEMEKQLAKAEYEYDNLDDDDYDDSDY